MVTIHHLVYSRSDRRISGLSKNVCRKRLSSSKEKLGMVQT